jgi:outer membrane protein assembly factor BamB
VITYSGTVVMGLDATTGAQLWQAAPSLPATGDDTFITQVFADDDETYYVWDGAKLSAFRAGNRGTQVWSAAVNTGDISAEFGGDDTMFVGSDSGFLYAVDTSGGGCRWQYPGGSGSEIDMVNAPIAAGDGYCFVGPGNPGSGTVVALAI